MKPNVFVFTKKDGTTVTGELEGPRGKIALPDRLAHHFIQAAMKRAAEGKPHMLRLAEPDATTRIVVHAGETATVTPSGGLMRVTHEETALSIVDLEHVESVTVQARKEEAEEVDHADV